MGPCVTSCGPILKVFELSVRPSTHLFVLLKSLLIRILILKLVNPTSCWPSPSDTTGWGVSPRGAGYLFGSDVVAQFNAANDIHMICRAHQLVMEGYKWHFNETVLTVWSAPNYCYRCANTLQNTHSQWLHKLLLCFHAKLFQRETYCYC